MSYIDIIRANETSHKPHEWSLIEFNKKVVCCYCGSSIKKKSKKWVGYKCKGKNKIQKSYQKQFHFVFKY